jgi:ERCC4-type nuclease
MINKFKTKYTKKQIDQILDSLTIIVDSREKVNSHIIMWLKHNKINYIEAKLDFGDYSYFIPKNLELDIEEDIMFNDTISVERKRNLEEVAGNITADRKRFKREFERGQGKMILMIEDSTYKDLSNGNYKSKVSKESFRGTLFKWSDKYGIPFTFIDSEKSGEYIYYTFYYHLKNILSNK